MLTIAIALLLGFNLGLGIPLLIVHSLLNPPAPPTTPEIN